MKIQSMELSCDEILSPSPSPSPDSDPLSHSFSINGFPNCSSFNGSSISSRSSSYGGSRSSSSINDSSFRCPNHCSNHAFHCSNHSFHCSNHAFHCSNHAFHCSNHSFHCSNHAFHTANRSFHSSNHSFHTANHSFHTANRSFHSSDHPLNYGPDHPLNYDPDHSLNYDPDHSVNDPDHSLNYDPDHSLNYDPDHSVNDPDHPLNYDPDHSVNDPDHSLNYGHDHSLNYGPDHSLNYGPDHSLNYDPDHCLNYGPDHSLNYGPDHPLNDVPDHPLNYVPDRSLNDPDHSLGGPHHDPNHFLNCTNHPLAAPNLSSDSDANRPLNDTLHSLDGPNHRLNHTSQFLDDDDDDPRDSNSNHSAVGSNHPPNDTDRPSGDANRSRDATNQPLNDINRSLISRHDDTSRPINDANYAPRRTNHPLNDTSKSLIEDHKATDYHSLKDTNQSFECEDVDHPLNDTCYPPNDDYRSFDGDVNCSLNDTDRYSDDANRALNDRQMRSPEGGTSSQWFHDDRDGGANHPPNDAANRFDDGRGRLIATNCPPDGRNRCMDSETDAADPAPASISSYIFLDTTSITADSSGTTGMSETVDRSASSRGRTSDSDPALETSGSSSSITNTSDSDPVLETSGSAPSGSSTSDSDPVLETSSSAQLGACSWCVATAPPDMSRTKSRTDDSGIDFELIEVLLGKQGEYMPELGYLSSLKTHGTIPSRSRSIQWIIAQAQSVFGYNTSTVALAINCFDRYLSKHVAQVRSVQLFELLALTCLSTAAKMEETSVSHFTSPQVDALEHRFDAPALKRMELLLLQSLGWRLRPVTPISFIDLALAPPNVCQSLHHMLLSGTSSLVLRSMSEAALAEMFPSVLAACAIRIVAAEKMGPWAMSCILSTQVEHLLANQDRNAIASCCRVMEKMIKETIPTASPPCMSGGNRSPTSVLINAMSMPSPMIRINSASKPIFRSLDSCRSEREGEVEEKEDMSVETIHTSSRMTPSKKRKKRSPSIHLITTNPMIL